MLIGAASLHLEPHCSHRGTSLEWGQVEEGGLRCCYHGWLFDTKGQCIDMPCETEEFRERMDVWHPAYPTMEYGGLVFVYMGPPGTEPLFPMYDIIDTRYRNNVVLRGMRLWGEYSVGFVKDCNWLQHYENIVDPWHLLMLHQMIRGDQFEGALMQGAPQIGFENTPLGVRYRVVKDLPNSNRFVRHAECVVPNAFLIPNIRETGTKPSNGPVICTSCGRSALKSLSDRVGAGRRSAPRRLVAHGCRQRGDPTTRTGRELCIAKI